MLPKYLTAGCGIIVDRRYHDVNPILVFSRDGRFIRAEYPNGKGENVKTKRATRKRKDA